MDQGDELQLVTGLRVVEDPALHAHRLRPHTRGTGDRGALLPGQGLCVGLDHGADFTQHRTRGRGIARIVEEEDLAGLAAQHGALEITRDQDHGIGGVGADQMLGLCHVRWPRRDLEPG